MIYCPSCGAENEDDAKFCHNCGATMSGDTDSAGGSAEPSSPGEGSDEKAPPPPPPPSGSAKPSGGSGPSNVNILNKLGAYIGEGFSEVFSDVGSYLLIGLVVGLISSITMGILAGPLMAGAIKVVRDKLNGKGSLDVGAVFSEGFAVFVPALLIVIILGLGVGIVVGILQIIPVLGQIVGAVIGIAILPLVALSLNLVIMEKKDFMPAIQESWAMLMQDIAGYLVFGLVAGIISGAGAIACGVGALITMPVAIVMTCKLLNDLYPQR
ncbi:MAG TPA: zinc-ribbon domain-containing protein [bacterium]|jgi:hypothetical protein